MTAAAEDDGPPLAEVEADGDKAWARDDGPAAGRCCCCCWSNKMAGWTFPWPPLTAFFAETPATDVVVVGWPLAFFLPLPLPPKASPAERFFLFPTERARESSSPDDEPSSAAADPLVPTPA